MAVIQSVPDFLKAEMNCFVCPQPLLRLTSRDFFLRPLLDLIFFSLSPYRFLCVPPELLYEPICGNHHMDHALRYKLQSENRSQFSSQPMSAHSHAPHVEKIFLLKLQNITDLPLELL